MLLFILIGVSYLNFRHFLYIKTTTKTLKNLSVQHRNMHSLCNMLQYHCFMLLEKNLNFTVNLHFFVKCRWSFLFWKYFCTSNLIRILKKNFLNPKMIFSSHFKYNFFTGYPLDSNKATNCKFCMECQHILHVGKFTSLV